MPRSVCGGGVMVLEGVGVESTRWSLKKVLEDGDGVEVNGVVDGDLEEVNEGEEDGGVVEVEEVNEGEEDGGDFEVEVEEEHELNVCEGVVEDEVYLCSWSNLSKDRGQIYKGIPSNQELDT
ncbi:hypothetical protein LR48_Vigan746s000300 [Vigna angularis]|uniref:Uncharacterized protein n=1 Tax=Phaseolus angularis TaxID=3914 RepID=A0A0L9TGL8_PHAAN|nr:hypothetical protein LR48_Vigan746s000300 [Vigna angularis]